MKRNVATIALEHIQLYIGDVYPGHDSSSRTTTMFAKLSPPTSLVIDLDDRDEAILAASHGRGRMINPLPRRSGIMSPSLPSAPNATGDSMDKTTGATLSGKSEETDSPEVSDDNDNKLGHTGLTSHLANKDRSCKVSSSLTRLYDNGLTSGCDEGTRPIVHGKHHPWNQFFRAYAQRRNKREHAHCM